MALDTTIGGAAADSYATLAEYTARASAMGWALADTDGENETNLRRAAIAIDASYVFRGTKNTVEQSREWPRYIQSGYGFVTYFDPYNFNSTEIPPAVKNAQMEMAHIIQGGADPLATVDAIVKREKVDVIEVEYLGGQGLPRFTVVDRLLRDYVTAGRGQSKMVRG